MKVKEFDQSVPRSCVSVIIYILNFFKTHLRTYMVDRSATAELATLKSVAAFWELLVRHGKCLPEYSSKYITEKQLLMIQANEIFSVDQV